MITVEWVNSTISTNQHREKLVVSQIETL